MKNSELKEIKKLIRETIENNMGTNLLNEGFPIQCCSGATLGNYTVNNANDGCDSLGLTDPPCQTIQQPDDELEPDDGDNGGTTTTTDPCDFTVGGNCASNAGLPNSFVNNNPSTFLANMQTRYTDKGCPHLQKILDRHQGHLNTGIHAPTGKTMGPNWIVQKQSKVDFLQCILDGPCCNDDGGVLNPGGETPDQPMGENRILKNLGRKF